MRKSLIILSALLVITAGCGKQGVLPEMKEFINSFQSEKMMTEVIAKYASKPDIVPDALRGCTLSKPLVVKTEKKNGTVIYTCETKVLKCERSETAVGTTRVFTIGWEKGKIVSFECKGPKSGKVEY